VVFAQADDIVTYDLPPPPKRELFNFNILGFHGDPIDLTFLP
jgi:hypothetical protein